MMPEDLEANGSHKVRQTLLAKSKLKEASRISTLLSGFVENLIDTHTLMHARARTQTHTYTHTIPKIYICITAETMCHSIVSVAMQM